LLDRDCRRGGANASGGARRGVPPRRFCGAGAFRANVGGTGAGHRSWFGRMDVTLFRLGPAALCLIVLAACTYRGADDPVSRKFSWFSYLNGDDIRRECVAGAADRYRFVYNGINVEQVRTYD